MPSSPFLSLFSTKVLFSLPSPSSSRKQKGRRGHRSTTNWEGEGPATPQGISHMLFREEKKGRHEKSKLPSGLFVPPPPQGISLPPPIWLILNPPPLVFAAVDEKGKKGGSKKKVPWDFRGLGTGFTNGKARFFEFHLYVHAQKGSFSQSLL